jgi:excisionase family DNA binding protein
MVWHNSLDELSADPSKIASVPLGTRNNLIARLSALILALTAAPIPAHEEQQAAISLQAAGEQRLLTAGELSKQLTLPESWLRTEERAGRIPGIRAGRYVRFKLTDVEAALARRKEAGAS